MIGGKRLRVDEADEAHRRYRLLLIASGLDGTDVSENAVAYDWASRLASRHDVTILTYCKRERHSARDQIPGVRFVEWKEWPLLNRARDLNNLMQPYYLGFYVGVRRWLRRALERGERFDIAHQLTPVAMRYPCPAVGLLDHVIVGPLGGALETPPGFTGEMAAAPMYTRLRELDRWRFKHDPILRRSMSEASAVLGVAPYVEDILAAIPLRRFEAMSEHGLTGLPPARPLRERDPGELRCIYVGRLIRSKGARDAIRALAQLDDLPNVTLDIVGDGEDRARCEAEVEELGLGERVRFHGWLTKSEVSNRYLESDALVFPSFREPSGRVLLEAMSYGLPVVAADYGGPGAVIDAEVGVSVPCGEPVQYARDISCALRDLANDPSAASRLGAAGRRRLELQYLWPAKIDWLERLYAEVLRS